MMCPRLLVLLDVARTMHGRIEISSALGAVGRRKGDDRSQHNIEYWNEVRAVDCFVIGVKTQKEAREFYHLARNVGFTGIGVYPQWTNNYGEQQVGFHLDTRRDRDPKNPATWGQVDNEWVSLSHALSTIKG